MAKRYRSSLYPSTQPPSGCRTLMRYPGNEYSFLDRVTVVCTSLVIVGSVVWVPLGYAWAWKRWSKIPKEDKRRRALYAALLLSLPAMMASTRSPRFGKWIGFKRWRMWQSFLRFVAFEVVADHPESTPLDMQKDRAIVAVAPHGIFPFAFALAALPEAAQRAFGEFRPVVATATKLLPLVRYLIEFTSPVDASRRAFDRALSRGDRIGFVPGGIAEMFEGYPKQLTHPDDEYTIVSKGFLRMAIKHGVPIVPVYCFGATKMLRRLPLPDFFENLSLMLRVSICVFYGVMGLPIPFRQRLLYVMGRPIFPPTLKDGDDVGAHVDKMLVLFCEELRRIFDRHKDSYGWSRKSLIPISRQGRTPLLPTR